MKTDILFTKPDNGRSEWEVWDGKIEAKWLCSAAEAYVRINRTKKGKWSLQYRLGKVGLSLPELFSKQFSEEEEVRSAIREFADWAFMNRSSLIKAHERSCD